MRSNASKEECTSSLSTQTGGGTPDFWKEVRGRRRGVRRTYTFFGNVASARNDTVQQQQNWTGHLAVDSVLDLTTSKNHCSMKSRLVHGYHLDAVVMYHYV